jgi:hypothetical protein
MARNKTLAQRKAIIELVTSLVEATPRDYVPPSEGTRPKSEHILPFSMVKGTRGYIERVLNQVNGCYEYGWFDSCAVMMRRLVETLIIECYERAGIADKIKSPKTSEFYMLKDLISTILVQPEFNIGRNAKLGLQRLKEIGDLSAHSRRYTAHREDIDKVTNDFRVVCQELLYLAKLK